MTGSELLAAGKVPLPPWLAGLLYGLALFLLAEAVVLPSAQSLLLVVPIWSFGLAHMIYGVTLGILVGQTRI